MTAGYDMAAHNYLRSRWDDSYAQRLDALDRLVYRSNLLGQDWRITNTGGGNTSSKITGADPLTGDSVEVLWVKGSGGDLRTARRANFASLYMDKLGALRGIYAKMEPRGPKTPAEDRMVGLYTHCTYNLNSRAPSIDTPLHAFVPYRHVDHTHPVACIALATAQDGPALTQAVYGDEVVWIEWQRPGFELGLALQAVCRAHPDAKGAILGGHGLINWADDDKECYQLGLGLMQKAAAFLVARGATTYTFGGVSHCALPEAGRNDKLVALLPWLRGRLSGGGRLIATVDTAAQVMEFVNSTDAERLAELGTSCPDHFLRTKIKPLYVGCDPAVEGAEELKSQLARSLAAYKRDYAAYYEAHKHDDSPPMRPSTPSVVLIPGLGMIAWGKSKSESRVTAEFYKAAIEVMRGAEAVSTYTALPRQEAFDIEYWQLEEAKLRRMPPEKEFSRRIVAVIGAGSGIGKVAATRLLPAGAVVAAMDVEAKAVDAYAQRMLEYIGMGIGVAGTGIAGCGDVIGLGCDITCRTSIWKALSQVVLAYGGLDHAVITAGLFVAPDAAGAVSDAAWDKMYAVNVKGPYLVADEAAAIWEAQQLSGSLVITTSVNAVVPKTGSFAYDTGKAATNHLVRQLACRLAPLVRVNAVAPATVLEGSAMFPRNRVIASLRRYRLPCDDAESTQTLRDRLAEFYAQRSLTKTPVTAADQAEAILLLLGERLGKTTGHVLTVDGGLREAFLR